MNKNVIIKQLEQEIVFANALMKEAIKNHSELCIKLSNELKLIEKNKSSSDKAVELSDGHSIEVLYKILDEYFEVMMSKSIVGKVIVKDLDALKADKELYNLIIISCGGKLLFDTYSNLLDYELVDGTKEYPFSISNKRITKRNKVTFVKRMVKKDIINGLLQYGIKCDLKLNNQGII